MCCQSQQIIQYLRKENKKLRDKNQNMYESICDMKEQNERLEQALEATQANYKLLQDHFQHIDETHSQLMKVIPKYKENINTLTDALEEVNQYCIAEHIMKTNYARLMTDVVDKVENGNSRKLMKNKSEIQNDIIDLCLEMEGKEHDDVSLPLPLQEKLQQKQQKHLHDSMSSSFHHHHHHVPMIQMMTMIVVQAHFNFFERNQRTITLGISHALFAYLPNNLPACCCSCCLVGTKMIRKWGNEKRKELHTHTHSHTK